MLLPEGMKKKMNTPHLVCAMQLKRKKQLLLLGQDRPVGFPNKTTTTTTSCNFS